MFASIYIYIYVSVSGCSRPTCHAARAALVHRAAPLLQVSPVPVEVRRGCSWTRACQGARRPTCHVARAATIKTAFPSFGTLWFSFLMLSLLLYSLLFLLLFLLLPSSSATSPRLGPAECAKRLNKIQALADMNTLGRFSLDVTEEDCDNLNLLCTH